VQPIAYHGAGLELRHSEEERENERQLTELKYVRSRHDKALARDTWQFGKLWGWLRHCACYSLQDNALPCGTQLNFSFATPPPHAPIPILTLDADAPPMAEQQRHRPARRHHARRFPLIGEHLPRHLPSCRATCPAHVFAQYLSLLPPSSAARAHMPHLPDQRHQATGTALSPPALTNTPSPAEPGRCGAGIQCSRLLWRLAARFCPRVAGCIERGCGCFGSP
jgi:hypothetical protein